MAIEESIQRTGLGSVGLSGGVPRELATKVTIDSVDYHVPKMLPSVGSVLDFEGATPNALDEQSAQGVESPEIDCLGKSTIVLRSEYSANNVTAPLWIVLIDANVDPGRMYLRKETPGNTGEADEIQETSHFHGEAMSVDISKFGATKFRVVLADVPTNSGTISVWAKAV